LIFLEYFGGVGDEAGAEKNALASISSPYREEILIPTSSGSSEG